MLSTSGPLWAQLPSTWPQVFDVDAQPLVAATRRVVTAMELAGSPLTPSTVKELGKLSSATTQPPSSASGTFGSSVPGGRIDQSREPREGCCSDRSTRVDAARLENFLDQGSNEAGVTAPLRITSPQAQKLLKGSSGSPEPKQTLTPADVRDRWLELAVLDRQPLIPALSGLALEYRLVQLHSRDAGAREATLAFDVGQGTQDLGFRNEAAIQFTCKPASEVRLSIRDTDGSPTTAALLVKDAQAESIPIRSSTRTRLFLSPPSLSSRWRNPGPATRTLFHYSHTRSGVSRVHYRVGCVSRSGSTDNRG